MGSNGSGLSTSPSPPFHEHSLRTTYARALQPQSPPNSREDKSYILCFDPGNNDRRRPFLHIGSDLSFPCGISLQNSNQKWGHLLREYRSSIEIPPSDKSTDSGCSTTSASLVVRRAKSRCPTFGLPSR
ncbi:hypothetical protein PAAG_03648 [Paracoccidioides lutzii Pb01]|uniref:Uncharacterized protein n=1 Tax=Paracoccidioides lutzii (strain ATCC MYA-826 / Pb01) TaxID=502779 RepID=C1GXS5_PARBA|nr:hypothetical protein PAAG_03648 [Paracoccidioides lutzii Pb01]EEH41363.2 hypothetical protein PAAG_03648 [Paracoccidioides lutzii Pb01]